MQVLQAVLIAIMRNAWEHLFEQGPFVRLCPISCAHKWLSTNLRFSPPHHAGVDLRAKSECVIDVVLLNAFRLMHSWTFHYTVRELAAIAKESNLCVRDCQLGAGAVHCQL